MGWKKNVSRIQNGLFFEFLWSGEGSRIRILLASLIFLIVLFWINNRTTQNIFKVFKINYKIIKKNIKNIL